MKITEKILEQFGFGKRTKLRRTISDFGIIKITPRERLCVLYEFISDKKRYIAYETETIQGKDCVNIEIVEQVSDKEKIILEKEIFEDSWGAMGGDSFYSIIIDSKNCLRRYIKDQGEFIISERNISFKQ